MLRFIWLGVVCLSLCQSRNVNLLPRQLINSDSKDVLHFRGDDERSDYFKLLERDGDSLMVGARNAVYNLSLSNLRMQERIDWPPTEEHADLCKMKGKSADDCHNYIRVMEKLGPGLALVCGTNAFRPTCRKYAYSTDGYQTRAELDGYAISPYDPADNSTTTYVAETDDLYAATVSDFAGNDGLIYRKPLADVAAVAPELRTERNDRNCLSHANFVSSFADDSHVYFWFRELAAERVNLGQTDTAVYSRVARVCKRDRGGPRTHANTWTTFVKARLNCSLPGDARLYFDELQASTEPVESAGGEQRVYAVLSTARTAVRASAVCAFAMSDVRRVFASSAFVSQPNPTALWQPVARVPSPRPGNCTDDSTQLPEEVVIFSRRNSLMLDSVNNVFDQPLLVDSDVRSELTQIAVWPRVRAVSGRLYDVVYVGTTDGRVLKLLNSADGGASGVVVESVRVFDGQRAVRNLMVSGERVVAVSRDEVRSVAAFHCSARSSCSACVRLQDPHCAWDLRHKACVSHRDWSGDTRFVQDIAVGRSKHCPEGDADPDLYEVNEMYAHPVHVERPKSAFSAGSMALAVIITLALASTLGFLLGYRLSRLKGANDGASSSTGCSDYDTHSLMRSRLTRHDAVAKKLSDQHIYGPAPPPPPPRPSAGDNVSIVLTLPPGSAAYDAATLKPEKNLIALNNGTLPKDYRVKKVYL